jgi:hypothetical protein
MEPAAVLITAGDGSVTGLKIWNTNCTGNLSAELFDECKQTHVSCRLTAMLWINEKNKGTDKYVFFYQQILSFIMHIKPLKLAIL